MGRVRRFDRPKVLLDKVVEIFDSRILMQVSRSSLTGSSAARLAPLLSMVTVSGTPFWVIDFSK
jgi:hypothetical protein